MVFKDSVRLALLRQVPKLWPPPPALSGARRRVLVVRPDHVGDLLLATPALRALRKALPAAHITCLVGPWSEPVLRRNPNVDEVLTCPFPGFTRRPKGFPWAPYLLLAREAGRLRAGRYDAAINLRFDFWWGALLAYAARIPDRWGYALPATQPFLDRPVPYQGGRHEVLQNLALVEAFLAGVRPPREESTRLPVDLPLEFAASAEDEAWAENWFRSAGKGRDLVALHVGAGAPVKLWGESSFAAVGQALQVRWGVQVVLVGGPGEEERAGRVASQVDGEPPVVIGRSLGEVGAILRRCRMAIGVDSGILHLAVAVGIPTVHLYGPIDPALFGPWGPQSRHAVVTSNLHCVPCNRLDYPLAELPRHSCITSIAPELVLQAAERVGR